MGSSSVNGRLSFHGDQISAHTATNNLLVDEDMRVSTIRRMHRWRCGNDSVGVVVSALLTIVPRKECSNEAVLWLVI